MQMSLDDMLEKDTSHRKVTLCGRRDNGEWLFKRSRGREMERNQKQMVVITQQCLTAKAIEPHARSG